MSKGFWSIRFCSKKFLIIIFLEEKITNLVYRLFLKLFLLIKEFCSQKVFHNLCFITSGFSPQFIFHQNLRFNTIDVHYSFCFITICVSSQFLFHHSLCFITVSVSSQFLFHHNMCFITICVLSQFVFHHFLCFITICVLSLCVGA